MGKICLLVVSVALSMLVAADANAQYFGRNKVEYEDFDFRLLHTEHFDVYYYPREEHAARLAAQLAERWYSRFARVLRHELDRRQPLVLYGSQAEFAQTNVVLGTLSDSVGGVTESARRRIAMPFAPTMAETNRVLGHEIVHAFQFDIARRHGGGVGQPLWFIEGMAEYLVRGTSDAESRLWIRDLALSDRVPRRQRDAARTLSPYQYGHAFWAYLASKFGDEVVEKALKPGKKQRKLNDRMRHATGMELEALYDDWRSAVNRLRPPTERADVTQGDGGSLTKRPTDDDSTRLTWLQAGRLQLGPSLSPDGKQAVFFSERDRLSLDLFLAEVATGRIIRKLATTAASARFDSLQPLRSTGAWSPEGDWFAFPAVRQGAASLTLLDMRSGGGDREIVVKDVGQVLSPTWSPDGKAIAFSALAGGFTDLYILDVESGTVRQLTNDPFADLHPAWSRDGRSIAFASERFSSDLAALRFGAPQLGIIDVISESVRALEIDTGSAASLTSTINPQWSADGRELYYVANRNGVTNVFRHSLSSPRAHQVTAIETGVSGVTPTSPALSVAGDAPIVAFTVYRGGRHQLAVLDASNRSVSEQSADGDESALNTGSIEARAPGLVNELLADPRGLPDAETIEERPYSPRMTLEQIGQPYVSSGGGPFGTVVRAGGGFLFGDMLGERRLGTAVQIGNRLRDAAFEARFLNQARRWNWGAVAELEPGIRRYRSAAEIEHDGQRALLRQTEYLQRVQWRAAGLVAYPFSRGLRVEFIGGVRYASYVRDLRSQVSSLATGDVLEEQRVETSGGVPTTIAEVGTALVGDTTVFGPTGPLLGSRYRFEVAPSIGSLAFTRVVADYRRYFMPVRPYSVAVRLLHSGRYGPDSEDGRLFSSFLGSRYFVRGYGLDASSCAGVTAGVCGGELIGSRMVVGNLELRFPILGMLSRQIEYGLIPADGFLFVDAGTMWTPEPGTLAHRRPTTIRSMGGGIRVNAGGLPLEIAAVRTVDGPRPRWLFDFGFRVGF